MTNKEAIKYLKQLYRLDEQRIEAISMAINALTHSVTKTIDKEEPISEDLEKEAERWRKEKGAENIRYLECAKHFANWQKRQMMKNAVEAEVIAPHGRKLVEHDAVVCSGKMATPFPAEIMDKFDIGDKVKLIIIKEG